MPAHVPISYHELEAQPLKSINLFEPTPDFDSRIEFLVDFLSCFLERLGHDHLERNDIDQSRDTRVCSATSLPPDLGRVVPVALGNELEIAEHLEQMSLDRLDARVAMNAPNAKSR